MIWRWNLHQLTCLAESQKALEARGCKPWAASQLIDCSPYSTSHKYYLLYDTAWIRWWISIECGHNIASPSPWKASILCQRPYLLRRRDCRLWQGRHYTGTAISALGLVPTPGSLWPTADCLTSCPAKECSPNPFNSQLPLHTCSLLHVGPPMFSFWRRLESWLRRITCHSELIGVGVAIHFWCMPCEAQPLVIFFGSHRMPSFWPVLYCILSLQTFIDCILSYWFADGYDVCGCGRDAGPSPGRGTSLHCPVSPGGHSSHCHHWRQQIHCRGHLSKDWDIRSQGGLHGWVPLVLGKDKGKRTFGCGCNKRGSEAHRVLSSACLRWTQWVVTTQMGNLFGLLRFAVATTVKFRGMKFDLQVWLHVSGSSSLQNSMDARVAAALRAVYGNTKGFFMEVGL